MSHFSRLKTKIRHREVLIQCLEDLGYTVETDTTIRGHEGKYNVDIAVKMGGEYGIGFIQGSDGTYDMIADWWNVKGIGKKRIANTLKEQTEMIQKEYVKKMVLRETAKDGFEVVSQVEETDGSVRIVVRRWV